MNIIKTFATIMFFFVTLIGCNKSKEKDNKPLLSLLILQAQQSQTTCPTSAANLSSSVSNFGNSCLASSTDCSEWWFNIKATMSCSSGQTFSESKCLNSATATYKCNCTTTYSNGTIFSQNIYSNTKSCALSSTSTSLKIKSCTYDGTTVCKSL